MSTKENTETLDKETNKVVLSTKEDISEYATLMRAKEKFETGGLSFRKSNVITIEKRIQSLFGVEADNIRIGAFSQGRRHLSGLTDIEEKVYLPEVIAADPADKSTWYAKVKDYFAAITRFIPNEGLSLEIGMAYASESDMNNNIKGYPINVEDYVFYRYVLVYPKTANDIRDYNPSVHNSYIDDPLKDKTDRKEFTKIRDKALNIYLDVKQDRVKVKSILYLFRKEYDSAYAEAELSDLAFNESTMEQFIDYATDNNLNEKVTIQKAIDNGDITTAHDNMYFYEDTALGYDIKEVQRTLNLEKNNSILAAIKSRQVQTKKSNKEIVGKPTLDDSPKK